MISFRSFFKQRAVKFFVIVFVSFLFLSNIALYTVSKIQYDREQNRQLDNYKTMMIHLITMENQEFAATYTEHFYHTQGIFIAFYDSENNLVYVTEEEPRGFDRIELLSDEGVLLGSIVYDNQNSILGNDYSYSLIILNAFSVILFLAFLQLLFWYLNSWYNLLEKDLLKIGKSEGNFNFTDLEAVNLSMLELIESERRIREYQKEYIKVLAHDIKTPLTVIKAYVEGMSLGKIVFSEAIALDLLNEVKEMEKLVPQFLEQSEDYSLVKQNIKPLIINTVNRLNEVFKQKNISLKLELDDYDLEVSLIDFSRIIENLLVNAFYYSYEDGLILISLEKVSNKLTIKDSGMGMDKETLSLIKKGPYRAQEAFEKHKKGSGMGLQIVFEIIERLGYNIDILSVKNKGTEIIITFK